jgi:hypothetical protein
VTVATMTLRDRALLAYSAEQMREAEERAKYQRECDEQQRQKNARRAACLVEDLARMGITAEPLPETGEATAEGLRFALYGYGNTRSAQVYKHCEKCGVDWLGYTFVSLEGLGSILAGNHDDFHTCPRWAEPTVPEPEEEPVEGTWKERALQAAEKHRATVKADQVGYLKQRVKQMLGVECEPEGERVTIDGVTFGLANALYGDAHLAVEGRCRKCGRLVPSRPLWNLTDVGQMIEHFEPGEHDCPYATTPEQRLISALRDIVGSHDHDE